MLGCLRLPRTLAEVIVMDIQLPASVQTVLPFFHPVIMVGTLALAIYALYLGIQVRRTRSATGETKKELVKGKFAQRHFQLGSVFLILIVFGTLGGMAVTYIGNGKLFVGAHLLAGLGVLGLAAVSAGLAPLMKDGQQVWARNLHIVINVVILGILGWQAATGVQIVQRILADMAQQPVA